MLDEARVARERVLADLGRRRSLLQAQVEELRQGRDRLLDAYRVVKRTFLDATEALAQVEARAATERALAPGPDNIAGEITVTESETRGRSKSWTSPDVEPSRSRDATCRRAARGRRRRGRRARRRRLVVRADPRRPDRGAGRGRRRHDPARARRAEAATETVAVTEVEVVVLETAAEPAADAPAPTPRPTGGDPAAAEPASGADAWRARHGAAVDPLRRAAREAGQARGPGRPERAARRGPPPQGPADRRRRCCATTTRLLARVDRACCASAIDEAYGAGRDGGRRRAGAAADDVAARSGRDDRVPAARSHRGRDRRRRRRRHERPRRAHRRALPRVEEPVSSSARSATCWSRRGRAASTTRRPTATVLQWIPLVGGPVRRLRRQRARTDGEGRSRSRPDRPIRPRIRAAAACWHRPTCSGGATRPSDDRPDITSARCASRRRRAAAPARPPRLADRRRGRPRHRSLEPARPRALLHRLPLVQGGRLRRHVALAARRPRPFPALIFSTIFFVVLLVNLIVADRLAPRYRGRPGPKTRSSSATARTSRRTRAACAFVVAVFFAIVMGSGVSSEWRTGSCSRNSIDFGIKDPQFHKDIGFYVFRLPFLEFVVGLDVRGAARGADRHRGVPLPQRRHPAAEPVPAGHAAGEGAPLGDPRADGAHEDRAVLPRPLRADALAPRRRRRRDLHRREGAAAGAEPADAHLDRGRGRCSSPTSSARAGCSRSSRSACGASSRSSSARSTPR